MADSPAHFRRLRRSLFGMLVMAAQIVHGAVAKAADYQGTGCSGEGPLLFVEGELSPVAQSLDGSLVYASPEWRLPISADRPEVLTEARLRVQMQWQETEPAAGTLQWSFTFNDPKPLGLPFTFQALAFIPLWNTHSDSARVPFPPAGEAGILEDWSSDCTDPGRSIFPGGSWNGSRPDEAFGTRPSPVTPLHFRLILWGSRS